MSVEKAEREVNSYVGLGIKLDPHGKQVRKDNKQQNRGSVRESGDSVERLEECSGARACTFGELGARGVRLECTVSAREASGMRLDARARGSVRLLVHCSPERTSFTRNHLNDLKC
ncbi:hypothetical protein CRG98_029507 [Punica granatum]|uniref:Uncharacterized protein n=1 Tax=Punica granatum TaxID=22663 RepID=A0A2I0J1L1_PUNGR|nr:hypothetical protein CRG98_029507 [Punica granatum]